MTTCPVCRDQHFHMSATPTVCPACGRSLVVLTGLGGDVVPKCAFGIGDKVSKVGGDYRFDGVVVCVFSKLSGALRLVVEDDRGVLHIYSEKNLKPREP